MTRVTVGKTLLRVDQEQHKDSG